MDNIAIMRRVIELSQRGMRGGFGGPYGTFLICGRHIGPVRSRS
jgi:hypothetical protein